MPTSNIKAVITAEDRASSTLKGFGANVGSLNTKLLGFAKVGAVAFGAAAVAATGFALKSAASFEQTRIGLENMLGSADKAKSLLKDLNKFAAETPFEFPELADATRQLVAFGFTGEKAFDTIKQLGDVSAAIGAPINDLAYLMGTLKTQGRAFTIDIRQFASRGIPIYEYLAKVLKTNTKEISLMVEEGKIGFPEVEKAFELMTSKGETFHNTMSKQSKTLNGRMSTLKDTIGITSRRLVGLSETGDIIEGGLFDKLSNGIQMLIDKTPQIVKTMQNLFDSVLPNLVQWRDNFMKVYTSIADYLSPKLEALWSTIVNKLIPALSDFWKNYLEPLVPIIGTVLVVSIGYAIDAINFWLDAFLKITGWIGDNTPIIMGFVATLAVLKGAMVFNAVVNAIIVQFNLLKLVHIPQLMTSFGLLKATIATPMIMPAIAIGAALAAIWKVREEGQKLQAVLSEVSRTTGTLGDARTDYGKSLKARFERGEITKEERARLWRESAPKFATGGFTGRGGMNEAAGIVHKGEYVVPKNQVDQNTGTPKINSNQTFNITVQAGAFMGSQQDARQYAKMIMEAYQDLMGMKMRTA